ncbi:MAG TPA: AAA family ATPase [Kofleriaceae bacterium]|nr:AAA family ATPase [Kofleriaceae bacterium]
MFVGRQRDLAELDRGLDELTARRGSVYTLVGEPGIGKTRTASEVAGRAAARGMRVSWGRCWEGGGAPAFWPWREALEGLGASFPEATSLTAGDPSEARFALFRAVAAELIRAASAAPVVIILEDLHAADRSTLLLFDFVAGQLRQTPAMIIGTYRDIEARLRPEASDVFGRIERTATVLHLARLREPEVAAFVREVIDAVDEQTVALVYDTTQGNPLFVAEVVRQIAAEGALVAVPLGVREIIRQRIALAEEETRRVLEAGAVLGVEFGRAEVARMVEDAASALAVAGRVGLVALRGPRARFTHALYREALYHDLPPARRHELHRAAARALEATGAPAAEVSHHLLEAGPDAAPAAIDQAIEAARQALEQFAFEDAVAVLERARLAIPPGPLEPALRCRVMIALGEARIRGGDAAGRELCVEAAALARELGDPALLAAAGLAYGAIFAIGGVDPAMVSILEEALEGLPRSDTGLRARTMARLAAARQPSPPVDRPRDIALALAAIDMGRRVASRREMLEVLQSASGALYGAADPRVRLPISRELEALAEQLGDTPRLLAARVRLAMDHLELGDLAAYAEVADAYERLAARIGRAAAPWRVPLMRSMLAAARGDFAGSERWQAESRRIDADSPRARRAQALHRICFLRAAERHGELRASLAELQGLWHQLPYGHALAGARVASVLAHIGADEEVRAVLADLPDAAWDEEINCASLAEAVWATGDRRQAERLLPVIAPYRNRWMAYWLDVEFAEAPTGRAVAYVSAVAGAWAECDDLFAGALRAVEDAGRPCMAARMRFELGDLLVRSGREPERARRLLAEARSAAAARGLDELVALIDRRHPDRQEPAGEPVRPDERLEMTREGEYYAITGPRGTLRFKASRGMDYLARLLGEPGREFHVLDLVGAAGTDRGDAGELVDRPALRAYRERLENLRDAAERAEALGDTERAGRAREEMQAVARELRRGSGLGGRARRAESAVDRARSAVQRRIKDALDRIAEQDADLGASLRRAIQTGNRCVFRPGR